MVCSTSLASVGLSMRSGNSLPPSWARMSPELSYAKSDSTGCRTGDLDRPTQLLGGGA